MRTLVFTPHNPPTAARQHDMVRFLFTHLEQYGDAQTDILKCLDYAFSGDPGKGGVAVCRCQGEEIIACTVVNHTGMSGYIPEHILVYIAVHGEHRGKGLGKMLMEEIRKRCEGSIALHVEPENPARKLYENMGFTNRYLEMRLHR